MARKIFFQQDFYTLQQRLEEDEFVDLLNQDLELEKLIAPSAIQIKDCIYEKLSGAEINIQPIAINEEEINSSLQKKLSGTRFFDRVDTTSSGKLYSFAVNSWSNRLFIKQPLHDSRYTVQTNVLYWLDYQVVKAIVSDDRFSSLGILLLLIEEMDVSHQFYRYLITAIPNIWIKNSEEEWTSAESKLDNVIDSLRTYDREYLETYKTVTAESSSPWKYIDQSARYADYVMLNEKYSFKCAVLLEHNISLWVKLWDNFGTAIMQDAALSIPGFDPHDLLAIADQLVQGHRHNTPLQYLILLLGKNLFDTSLRTRQRLSFYSDDQQSHHLVQSNPNVAVIIAEGQEAQKQWESERKGLYVNFFNTIKPVADRKVLDEFIFSLKHRSQPANTHTDAYNEEIDMVIEAYRSIFMSGSKVDLSDLQEHFNLEKFNFYVSAYQEIGIIDEGSINVLLTQLLLFTSSEEYFWDRSFNPPFLNVMKGIGYLLSKSNFPITEAQKLIDEVKVTQEGWNISRKPFQLQVRECFFYCGLILLLEHENAFKNDERAMYYKDMLALIIQQSRYSIYDHEDYYLQPLIICYLVACQIFTEMKPHFEKLVVTSADKLYTVLAVLTATSDTIEADTKNLLEARTQKELPFELRKLKGKNLREQIAFYHSAMRKLALEPEG